MVESVHQDGRVLVLGNGAIQRGRCDSITLGHIRAGQIGSFKVSLPKPRPAQLGTPQMRSQERRTRKLRAPQIRPTQPGVIEIRRFPVATSRVTHASGVRATTYR